MTGKISILSIIILISTCITAQNPNIMADKSAESWSVAEFRYQSSKKFRFGIEQQLRFNENISIFDRTFTELYGRYYFWDDFNFGLAYRYMFLNDNSGQIQGIENHYRWDYFFSHEFKLKRLEFENRIKYQRRKEIRDKSISCICQTRNYWRFKSEIIYKIKNWKYDPYFSSEIFLPTNKREKRLHNRYRLALGTSVKISKKQKIRIKYLFEREIKGWNPEAISIFQIKYIYAIKKKK